MTDVVVHETVAPGFERVRAAFEENFRRHGDKGASVGVNQPPSGTTNA
jgi:hypothetical protein